MVFWSTYFSTRHPFICWFPMFFRCEGLRFPPFTSVHRPCECFAAHVNTLKSKPSHSKPPVNQKKTSIVWTGEYFFREIKYVYIHARKESISRKDCVFFSEICPLHWPSRTQHEVIFTSRRQFRTSPGVDKTSPGVDKTSPGLVGSNSRTCGRSISCSLLYGSPVNVQDRPAAPRGVEKCT